MEPGPSARHLPLKTLQRANSVYVPRGLLGDYDPNPRLGGYT